MLRPRDDRIIGATWPRRIMETHLGVVNTLGRPTGTAKPPIRRRGHGGGAPETRSRERRAGGSRDLSIGPVEHQAKRTETEPHTVEDHRAVSGTAYTWPDASAAASRCFPVRPGLFGSLAHPAHSEAQTDAARCSRETMDEPPAAHGGAPGFHPFAPIASRAPNDTVLVVQRCSTVWKGWVFPMAAPCPFTRDNVKDSRLAQVKRAAPSRLPVSHPRTGLPKRFSRDGAQDGSEALPIHAAGVRPHSGRFGQLPRAGMPANGEARNAAASVASESSSVVPATARPAPARPGQADPRSE